MMLSKHSGKWLLQRGMEEAEEEAGEGGEDGAGQLLPPDADVGAASSARFPCWGLASGQEDWPILSIVMY